MQQQQPEIEYLREGAMLVTSSRVEIEGQTFAVRNIGSVKVDDGGRPWGAALLAFIGIAFAMRPDDTRVVGFAFLAGAVFWGWRTFTQRKLVLNSGGGEVIALTGRAEIVQKLHKAIADAIAAR